MKGRDGVDVDVDVGYLAWIANDHNRAFPKWECGPKKSLLLLL